MNYNSKIKQIFALILLLQLIDKSKELSIYASKTLSSHHNQIVIQPGTGLIRRRRRVVVVDGDVINEKQLEEEEIVIFEHTDMGTGGLVLNCPTPLLMKDISSPTFERFGSLPLMLGCGNSPSSISSSSSDDSNIAMGDLTPWFWLHNIDDISGSYCLEGASGPLYMGGNIEELATQFATSSTTKEETTPPNSRTIGQQNNKKRDDNYFSFYNHNIKFFRRYISWGADELELEIKNGFWFVESQDPERALQY